MHYSYTLAQKASNYGIFCFYYSKRGGKGKEQNARPAQLAGGGKQVAFVERMGYNGSYNPDRIEDMPMRPDGTRVKNLPPIVAAIPYIMPKRYDAQNSITENIDEEVLKAYIREKRPNLKIYGACYPEKHPQAATLEEDIDNLKKKVDAGVSHLISQLFYDNDDFYRFLDKAHAAGIDVPIEAGIMPVRGGKSVRRMAKVNASRIPAKLEALLDRWGDDIQNLRAAGIIYASDQIADLVAHGVDGVHLYSMNHPATTRRIWRNVEPLFTVE